MSSIKALKNLSGLQNNLQKLWQESTLRELLQYFTRSHKELLVGSLRFCCKIVRVRSSRDAHSRRVTGVLLQFNRLDPFIRHGHVKQGSAWKWRGDLELGVCERDGYGYVIQRREGRKALACTCTSTKLPHRAPESYVLIRVFVGRAGQNIPWNKNDLLGLAKEELK